MSSIAPLRRARLNLPSQSSLLRLYSTTTTTTNQPLIRTTNLPAPGSGHIRILELNRPSARNALSKAMVNELRAHVEDIHAQYGQNGEEVVGKGVQSGGLGYTRAVVLASAVDSCFCAGADLKERKGFSQKETNEFLTNLNDTFTSISNLPIPSISAISSLALGGGLELALTTHFRVLSSNATIGLPETRLAILPGAGGTYRLPALIGISRARDLILTGRRVAAPEAYFLGVADRLVDVVPEEGDKSDAGKGGSGGKEWSKEEMLDTARRSALSEAVRLAGEICEGGPVAVRAALEAVGWARPEKEREMYGRVVNTEDRDEALKAFGEKRKPAFKGR